MTYVRMARFFEKVMMQISTMNCLLCSVLVLSACQPKEATNTKQNHGKASTKSQSKPSAKTPEAKPQAKSLAKVWTQTINGVVYQLTVTPYEHAPRQWFFRAKLAMTTPKSAPVYVVQSFWQKDETNNHSAQYINPFRFEEVSTKFSDGQRTSISTFEGIARKQPIEMKPGSTRSFLYDARLGSGKRWWSFGGEHLKAKLKDRAKANEITPDHHTRIKICISSIAEVSTLVFYAFCLVDAHFKLNASNQMHVELKGLSKDTVRPSQPVYQTELINRKVQINAFKKGWEKIYTSSSYKLKQGIFYAQGQPWRNAPVVILYRQNQMIVGDHLYENLPKDGLFVIDGDVLSYGGKAQKFKQLTQDQVADAYPGPQEEDDYHEHEGYKVFFRDALSWSFGAGDTEKDNQDRTYYVFKQKGLNRKNEHETQVVHIMADGRLLYKQRGMLSFVAFGKVKKGDKIQVSMHRVWVNDQPRAPKK